MVWIGARRSPVTSTIVCIDINVFSGWGGLFLGMEHEWLALTYWVHIKWTYFKEIFHVLPQQELNWEIVS